jgi:Cyclic nucleotide-binding domain/Major Facilitator Superfamily
MSATAQRVQLLGRAWRKGSLRRLCLAVAGFRLSELAVWIALAAYAYTAGGVREASAVTVAQLIPATAFAFAVGGLIRRHGATSVLRWGLVVQSAGMLVAAVYLHDGANIGAFIAAMVTATAVTTTRPAQSAALPSMVDGPDELTAANVFSGGLVAAAELVGPASAAVIMTTVGSWAVFAVMSVVMAASAAAVWRLPATSVAADDDPESVIAGIRATARATGPRIMVIAIAAYYVVIGALDVLAVVIAVELLRKSEAYSGFVTTAIGVGCLIAGALTVMLIGRRWIAPWILISGLAIGVSLVAVSLAGSSVVTSMAILVTFGVATATYELTALMLLQRVSRLDIIAQVFALVEALQMAMLAIGAALVPLAVHLFGSHWAPAAVGVLFVAFTATIGTSVVLIDRNARVPITEMATLRATPLFGALPGPALETVAREARRIEAKAGTAIVVQGEPGMEYFAVISGNLVVSIDGTDRSELGRGDGFGEIALLRDVPRAATVRVISDAVLLAVDREPFLTAVTGHAATGDRASSIAAKHLEQQ